MDQRLIITYVEYLRKKGYSERTIHAYSKALEQVPDAWNTDVPRELYEHINNTLSLKQECFSPAARHNIRPASSLLFQMVTGIPFKSCTEQTAWGGSVHADILKEFYIYSTEFKHMTVMSAQAETHHISEFLNSLDSVPDDWREITAEKVRDYACIKFSGLKPSSAGRYVTSLRNFFRFLEYKGCPVSPSVLNPPLVPADRGRAKVPVILSPDEEIRLRSHYKADNEAGRRSRIIILLMLDLGLRCSEVSSLQMADICWNKGTLWVRRTKNRHARELPLSQEIGELLEDYVINHRPHLAEPRLFLRKTFNGQYTAMSCESVRGVIRRALKKEQIQGWWKGTHTLRRTAASKIYNTGNSLKITADLLGHESLDSTKQYVRVSFSLLREAAMPWPGGGLNE